MNKYVRILMKFLPKISSWRQRKNFCARMANIGIWTQKNQQHWLTNFVVGLIWLNIEYFVTQEALIGRQIRILCLLIKGLRWNESLSSHVKTWSNFLDRLLAFFCHQIVSFGVFTLASSKVEHVNGPVCQLSQWCLQFDALWASLFYLINVMIQRLLL